MRPYSQDLRERVASACTEPGRTIAQVAATFRVSTAFLDKLLRWQRTPDSVAAWPHTGDPVAKLDAAARGATGGLGGPAAGHHTGRTAGGAGSRRRPGREPDVGVAGAGGARLAAKKKSVHATERATEHATEHVKALRATFLEAFQGEDFTHFNCGRSGR